MWWRPPPMLQPFISLRLLPFLILLLQLLGVNGQFGELASVITSLIGSTGTGAGLAGLGGTGAGLAGLGGTGAGLAGAGSSAAQGASAASAAGGALAGFGQLYQLAQAALSLTGTGVNIANQASEGAWFPVAVEHAARMNRDFQDRLLQRPTIGKPATVEAGHSRGGSANRGFGGLPGLGGLEELGGTLGGGGHSATKLGTEYGKNFETDETDQPEVDLKSFTPSPSRPLPPAFAQLGPQPSASAFSFLPGETPISGSSTNTLPTWQNGVTSAWELSTPFQSTTSTASTIQTTTVDFLSHHHKPDEEEKSDLDFNIDSAEANREGVTFPTSRGENNDRDLAEQTAAGIIPGSNPNSQARDKEVPKLTKLVEVLKASNLSKEEFAELAAQLQPNADLHLARENPAVGETSSASHYKPTPIGEHGTIVNEKRDKAANLNLQALNKGLSPNSPLPEDRGGVNGGAGQGGTSFPPPVVITLRRPEGGKSPAVSGVRVHTARVVSSNGDEPTGSRHGGPRPRTISSNQTTISRQQKTQAAPLLTPTNGTPPQASYNSRHPTGDAGTSPGRIYSTTNSRVPMPLAGSWEARSNPSQAGVTPSYLSYASTTSVSSVQFPQQTTYQHSSPAYYAGQQRLQPQQSWYPLQYYPYGYPQSYHYWSQYASNNQPRGNNPQPQPQVMRIYPARTLPEPASTTAPAIIRHPFGGGQGTLLTLTQPTILRHYAPSPPVYNAPIQAPMILRG